MQHSRVQRRDPRDDPDADVQAPEAPVLMEGPLRKQGARVHMWSQRYAVLQGPRLLMYRGTREEVQAAMHPTSSSARGSMDYHHPPPPPLHKRELVLMPGCYVSEIRELPGAAGGKGRSLWEFRLHWPEHVRHYGQGHGDGALKLSSPRLQGLEDSDDEEGEEDEGQLEQEHEQQAPTTTGIPTTQEGGGGGEGATPRPLQRVAGQTARTARRQLHRGAEIEQAEQAHQSLVSKGATLAGVVVGGVVIGALTAGVGLVPYLGLVGTAAVVSGGAVAYTAAQAPGSRVVLAAETESEALRWKGALELQVAVLEGRRPPPPPEIDLQDVDELIRSTAWRSVGAQEGLRVLEEERGSKQRARAAALCRKMQTVIQATPLKVFLAFMATEGTYHPPEAPTAAAATAAAAAGEPSSTQAGPMRRMAQQGLWTVQQIDDHTDVVYALLQPLPTPPAGGTGAAFLPSAASYLGPLLHPLQRQLLQPRDLCLLRYWRLDDDGVYTVCLTSVQHDRCPERPGVVRAALNGVLSVAPRRDYADFDDDLPECLATYIVEVDPKGALAAASTERVYRPLAGLSLRMAGHWRGMYADLVLSQVLDVKETLESSRFCHRDASMHRHSSSLGGSSSSAITTAAAAFAGSSGHPTSHSSSSTSIGRSLKARLYASSSRRRKKNAVAASAAAAAATAGGMGSIAAAAAGVGGSPSPERSVGSIVGSTAEPATARTQQVAAAALRARIASQEYAVRRLETELGKGGGTPMLMNVGAGAVLMASGSSGALLPPGGQQPQPGLQQQQHRREPSAVLLRQLQAHVDEARRLRAEYRALTGKDYVALGGAAGLTVSTAVSAATAAAAPAETASAPLSPSSQQHRHRPRQQPLSPRRLLQRPHSHHEGPSPPRVHTQQHHPGFHVDEGVGSLLACSAPAAPLRELDEQGAAMFPARHAERVHGGAGEEAVMLDPFRWEDGVPGHWHTRAKAEAQARRHGALTWEAVWARLVVLLCFCAMLFAALFVRRFLPTWEGRVGGGEEL